tara:strand:+ start:755 stop:1045 length:291 start_codon:yes stop_codon:yes gene_type:complete
MLELKKRENITLSELKDMLMTWYKPFKLYTTKLNGANRYYREAFTVSGPSGRAVYNYAAKGYMVVFDDASRGFRTVVWNNIEKVTDINADITYYVR